MKILIADNSTNSFLLRSVLQRRGHHVLSVEDGRKALDALRKTPFDALITAWMMPTMDGVTLIRKMRETLDTPPYTLMITSTNTPRVYRTALGSGADDFLSLPLDMPTVMAHLEQGVMRSRLTKRVAGGNEKPAESNARSDYPGDRRRKDPLPPYVGVCIAASTGGPVALTQVISALTPSMNTCYFSVLHAPTWALDALVRSLSKRSRLDIELATNDMPIRPGCLYISPGDYHMSIARCMRLRLEKGERINFVRSSADPMMKSAAALFGKYCIGVVLTGLGRDGTDGARAIRDIGGHLIVENPKTAIANPMPRSVVDEGLEPTICSLDRLPRHLMEEIDRRGALLSRAQSLQRR